MCVCVCVRACVCVCVQRETLLRQLETNQLDMDATLEELCVQQETEDQNYEMYCLPFFFLSDNYCTEPLEGQFSCADLVYCVLMVHSGEHQKYDLALCNEVQRQGTHCRPNLPDL